MKISVMNPESNPKNELSQVESEFAQLLKIAATCRSALEIGSLYGGSAKRIAEAMPEGSRMVCVDYGFEKLKPGWNTLPALLGRLSSVEGRDVHLILGDSTDKRVIAEVERLGPFDLVFIDGGHNDDVVRSDWAHYGALGKIVALHDVESGAAVKKLWKELRGIYPRQDQFIDGDAAGIGVIWKG